MTAARKIVLKDGREIAMDEVGLWHCPADPTLEAMLRIRFRDEDSAPYSLFPPGTISFDQAVTELKGLFGVAKVERPKIAPPKEGEVS